VFVDHDSSHDASVMARPAVESISAWATHNEVFPLHASAVSREDDGLLLVGEGGRGKTTTALALAMCGWDLIADDRCFVNTQNEELFMHALYRTSIVTSEVANRFPELLGEHFGITVEGKIATYLPKTIKFAQSSKIRGLVLLSQNHDEPYQMTRLTPREALTAWQQALMFADISRSPERSLFSLLTKASRNVPAWRMNLGWDFQKLDKILRRHMEKICTTLITK
jgi:serine kinase of HPr protein (carbohydrate metabolism regulator)